MKREDNKNVNMESFWRMMLSIISRAPQDEIERFARMVHAAASSPTNPGQFFNPFSLVNKVMPQEMLDTIATGVLANLQRLMSSKKFRMDGSNIAVAPPLSGPVPNVTLSAGDIDLAKQAAENSLMDKTISALDKQAIKSAWEAVDRLDNARNQRVARILSNTFLHGLVHTIGTAAINALNRSVSTNSGYLQSLAKELAAINGTKPAKVNPDDDFYHNPKTLAKASSGDFGQGAIPIALYSSLAKAGKFIIDYGPLVISLYNSMTGKTGASSAATLGVSKSPALNMSDKSLPTLAANLAKAKYTALSALVTKADSKMKAIPLSYIGGAYDHPNAKAWRDVYARTTSVYLVKYATTMLQKALAKAYASKNPEQKEIIALLDPIPGVPFHQLMQSTWDPFALSNPDVVWSDFSDYAEYAMKKTPSLKNLLKGKPLSSFKRAFLEGSSTWATDMSVTDRWGNVVDAYFNTYYKPYFTTYLNGAEDYLAKAYQFSKPFGGDYKHVTPAMIFKGNDASQFAPWSQSYMTTFNQKVSELGKAQSSNNQSTNTGAIVGNNQNQGVIDNPIVTYPEKDNPLVNNTTTSINPSSGIKGPTSGSEGTILITPNETVVGMGHYIDPETGTMSDYRDLYELGKAIRDLKERASLYIQVPGAGDFSGDPLTGGIFGAAAKVAGKLLKNTKVGKKIIEKTSKVASKIPIVKKLVPTVSTQAKAPIIESLVTNNPTAIKALADNANVKEETAVSNLESITQVPNDPQQVVEILTQVKQANEVLSGISPKLDEILAAVNSISLNSMSASQSLPTGEAEELLDAGAPVDIDYPYSAGDLLAAALGDIDFDDSSYGDIDLWRVYP